MARPLTSSKSLFKCGLCEACPATTVQQHRRLSSPRVSPCFIFLINTWHAVSLCSLSLSPAGRTWELTSSSLLYAQSLESACQVNGPSEGPHHLPISPSIALPKHPPTWSRRHDGCYVTGERQTQNRRGFLLLEGQTPGRCVRTKYKAMFEISA